MLTVTSYHTDRRGNIIASTLTAHTTLTDAVDLKKGSASDEVIVFVGCEQSEKPEVVEFLAERGLELYDTRTKNRYVMGNQKRPQVSCALK